jgi:hypothetical protein
MMPPQVSLLGSWSEISARMYASGVMSIGGGQHPRIAWSELDTDRSMRRRGAVVESRDLQSGSWTVLATFGSETKAAERLDEELGLGHGAPADYRIRPVGIATWKRWVGIGGLVILAVTFALMLVLFRVGR